MKTSAGVGRWHPAVATLLAKSLTDRAVDDAIRAIEDSADGVVVTGVKPLSVGQGHDAVELNVLSEKSSALGVSEVCDVLKAQRGSPLEIVVQKDSVTRRSKRLAVFDLDSTLITSETIDELAEHAGKAEEVAQVTRSAMAGKMDYRTALEMRLAFLRGLGDGALEKVISSVQYTPGARRVISALRALGCRTAICSGGFTFLTDYIQRDLGVDVAVSNELQIEGGALTGEVVGAIVDGAGKLDVLQRLAREMSLVDRGLVMAVGDGANDLPMLGAAGLGVAFNAKPSVQARAPFKVNSDSLETLLHLLGMTDADIDMLSDPECAGLFGAGQ